MAEEMGNIADSIDDQYFLALLGNLEDLAVSDDEKLVHGCLTEEPFLDLDENYAKLIHLQEALFSSTTSTAISTQQPVAISVHHHKSAGHNSLTMLDSPRIATSDVSESSYGRTLCVICAEIIPLSEMFRNPNCGHAFCKQCVRRYISTNLQEQKIVMRCLELGCGGALEPEHFLQFLPGDVSDRWASALSEAAVFHAGKRFYCPFRDCSAPLLDESEGDDVTREAECPHCHRLFCVRCGVPWHDCVECSEFQKLGDDERGHLDLMLREMAEKKRWRRCPSCRFYVEKAEGCLHITCRCGTEFCYVCGSTWSNSHTRCHT